MSEFDLIDRFFSRPAKRRDVLLGVGDDAAITSVPADRRLVSAIDTIVAGVHFPFDSDPFAIGHRALAVNLSDLAAMGANPAWATLSLSIESNDPVWLGAFSAGLYALAEKFDVDLIGGDTVRGPLSVTVSIMGLVETDIWLTRSGAKPGDMIFISGCTGEAAAGLAVLQRGLERTTAANELVKRFEYPEPRIQLGRTIRMLASAAIDVSDGLVSDLAHICGRSSCGAHIDVETLPRSPSMASVFAPADCEHFALSGGDDYELLFTVPQERILDVEAAIAKGVRCTPIGRMIEGSTVSCFRDGKPIATPKRGYDHFAD